MKIGIQTWGTEGDARPFIALAGGLSAAGHDVTLAVTEVTKKDLSSYATELRFRLEPICHIPYDEEYLTQHALGIWKERNPLKQIQKIVTYFFDPFAEDILASAKVLCRENDLVIRHVLVYPLGIAAEKQNIPCLSVYIAPGIPTKHFPPPGNFNIGKTANVLFWKIGDKFINKLFKPRIDRMRVREGLPEVSSVIQDVWASSILNLVAVSPSLFPRPPDWADHFQVCGFFNMPEQAEPWSMPEDLELFIQAGSPPVYFTFGTMLEGEQSPEEVTNLMVESVRLAGCRAIIQSKWDKLTNIPAHPDIFQITRAPHQHIFPLCAAVVHHGGAGTTQTATFAGCPSVVVAHSGDQTFWGEVLHRAGIAPKHLHRMKVDAKKLSVAIQTVLNSPELTHKAKKISEKMKDENGIQRAVKLIENL